MASFVYHERQEALLCGQHCINNLLQEPEFDAATLADIGQDLDKRERSLSAGDLDEGSPDGEASQNVGLGGNFSIQVLTLALARKSVQLSSWMSEENRDRDPLDHNAFVFNRQAHWFTVRKVNGKWWNLNSTLKFPEQVTDFALSAFLAQMLAEGFFVYFATGNILPCGRRGNFSFDRPLSQWWGEAELAAEVQKAKGPVDVFKTGKANRVGGESQGIDQAQIEAIMIANTVDEDTARALIMSMMEPAKPLPTSKEAIRAARLAAMGLS